MFLFLLRNFVKIFFFFKIIIKYKTTMIVENDEVHRRTHVVSLLIGRNVVKMFFLMLSVALLPHWQRKRVN